MPIGGQHILVLTIQLEVLAGGPVGAVLQQKKWEAGGRHRGAGENTPAHRRSEPDAALNCTWSTEQGPSTWPTARERK